MSTWYIDPSHSAVTFGVKHLMVSTVHGRFGRVRGTVEFDRAQPDHTKISGSVEVNSIDTNDANRDAHLKGPDFFDAERYPTAVFESTVVEPMGGNSFRVKGNLTMHGQKRPVTFEAEFDGIAADQFGGQHLGASATLTIDRSHFGMVFNRPIANGVMVGDKVKVELALSALDEATAVKMGVAQKTAA